MTKKRRPYEQKTTVILPYDLLDRVDALSEEVDASRSEVITELLMAIFEDHENIIDEVFPLEEDLTDEGSQGS